MFTLAPVDFANKAEAYRRLEQQLVALLAGERDAIANQANTAALIFHALPNLNWVGFYRWKNDSLVLGPFQGKPACVRIPLGKGVCGTAAARRQTIIVGNVHEFSGHIACDPASVSEIVVPLVQQNKLAGVLDLDSPVPQRFDDADREGLERLVAVLMTASDG